MSNSNHPKHWYIIVTAKNQEVVSKWRWENATSYLTENRKIMNIGTCVMSSHPDGSCYYGGEEYELNNKYPDYVEINFETFLEITNKMKLQSITKTVTREQFKKGHELACPEWKQKLMDKFGEQLILNDTIEVSLDYIEALRGAASNSKQIDFLNELFPIDGEISTQDLKIGETLYVKKSNHLIMRTYSEFVDLNSPNSTWDLDFDLKGVKVKITITMSDL